MIESLSVSNYVLIDNLDLEFSSGLNTITGETGSGKSIILGALSLLLGAKGDRECIRKGKDRAEISGVFYTESGKVKEWLKERDISFDDNTLIIRRVIKAEGRNLYSINGTPLSIKEGEEIGELLVDFSSQHAHHSLMKKDVQRNLLDDFSSSGGLLDEYRKSYTSFLKAKEKLSDMENTLAQSREEEDYMSYCLKEIESASLKEGEEEELKDKLKILSSSEFLKETIEGTVSDISNASSKISSALSSLEKASRKDESLTPLYTRLESSSIEIDDILETLTHYSTSLSFSEGDIEEINGRLSVIQRVKRRYGQSVENALKTAEEYREKLNFLSDSTYSLGELKKDKDKYEKETRQLALKLTKKRKEGALLFGEKIEKTLKKLGMENASFKIEVSKGELSSSGEDNIEYLIAPNKGEKMAPIQSIASGGELSRIMLAVKAQSDSLGAVDTFLFDEIDSGLGGVVASFVADELKALSRKSQVITITHLPQIASRADTHFLVKKETVDDRTISRIEKVTGENREKEIARLLSGDTSAISLEHARELLNKE